MKAKLVKPENTLKKKAGNGGFSAENLAAAQGMIEKNDIDFRPAAHDLLEELGQIQARIATGEIKPEKYFDEIMYPLMQLKSQGALFGYPLVTSISHLIIDFMEGLTTVDAKALEIVEAYRKTMRAVLLLELKAPNNESGNALYHALSDVCARHAKAVVRK